MYNQILTMIESLYGDEPAVFGTDHCHSNKIATALAELE